MGYLTIIGGGIHRMADHRHALRASYPVSHRARDRRHQRLLRAHDRIDVPDQTGRRQQDRDLHRRSRLLPRHAGGHPRRAGDHQHGVLHRSQGRGPRSFCKGAGGARTGRRPRHARRGCDWKFRRIPFNGEAAQGSGLPGPAVSRPRVVSAGPPEQSHAPGAARGRRARGVHRRRRPRGLVAEADPAQAGLARHDGSRRGPRGRQHPRHRGRELAGLLRRDPHRPGCLQTAREGGNDAAFALKSSPADRATASRVLFQTLVEGCDPVGPHRHAVFSAGQGVSARSDPHCQARREDQRGRARQTYRSAVGPAGEPADVWTTPGGRACASSSTSPA